MLHDDHSNYCWFFATADKAAEHAASAIADLCASFDVPKQLMSDGPTHFKNETGRMLTKYLRVPRQFTLPYTPRSNGAVERVGKELVRTLSSMMSELRLDLTEWPDLLLLVQSVVNNAPSPARPKIAPETAFTGHESTQPIQEFLDRRT